MATILQTATCIAARLGRPNSATYIRCARQRGYLPHSGRGGRGSVGTPRAETEHTLLLLLAMLLPETPKRAVEMAREYLAFRIFEARRWTARDGIATSGAMWAGTFPTTAAEGLALIVNLYRRGLEGGATALPIALRVGQRYGCRVLEVVTRAPMPADDGTAWGAEFLYAPEGTHALGDEAVPTAGRCVVAEVGGSIFSEIARLLGPLPSSSGGSGDPLAREPIASDDEDEELPLAAAPACSLENERNEIDEETPRVAPLAGRGLRMAH